MSILTPVANNRVLFMDVVERNAKVSSRKRPMPRGEQSVSKRECIKKSHRSNKQSIDNAPHVRLTPRYSSLLTCDYVINSGLCALITSGLRTIVDTRPSDPIAAFKQLMTKNKL